MPGPRWCSKKFLVALALLVLLLGGLGAAWRERTSILAWYYVRGLARASSEDDRNRWADRVAGLGEPAVEGVLHCLMRQDEVVCTNARAGLARLASSWAGDEDRSVDLAGRLVRAFPRLSPPGQRAVLEVAVNWFPLPAEAPGPSPRLLAASARLLGDSASVTVPEVQSAALALATALVKQPQATEALNAAREVGRANLRSTLPANRRCAIQLSLLHAGIDLLDQVAPLLKDPVAEVRRDAILAVGPATAADVVHDEALLPCLHDVDPEVRSLCERALVGRGLSPHQIRLGRLLTHPQATERLRVLDHLGPAQDVDPGLWLRRLSHDPSPAVRSAALRAMSQQDALDLSDRIDQMARSDPSPTVCQIAQFYLKTARQTVDR